MSRRPSERRSAPGQEPCPEGLLCALTLNPNSVPRNRFFWVYTEPRARRMHGRARALRRLASELGLLLRNAPERVQVSDVDRGLRIGYRDDVLALRRRVTTTPLEASLLRALLSGVQVPLPDLLRPRIADWGRIHAALRRLDAHPEIPGLQVPVSDALQAVLPARER